MATRRDTHRVFFFLQARDLPGTTYSLAVDLWSCGVVLFILLSGQPPFFHAEPQGLYRKILKGAFAFQDPIWDVISSQCVTLCCIATATFILNGALFLVVQTLERLMSLFKRHTCGSLKSVSLDLARSEQL
jgi:serine/threonine protein kinase